MFCAQQTAMTAVTALLNQLAANVLIAAATAAALNTALAWFIFGLVALIAALLAAAFIWKVIKCLVKLAVKAWRAVKSFFSTVFD